MGVVEDRKWGRGGHIHGNREHRRGGLGGMKGRQMGLDFNFKYVDLGVPVKITGGNVCQVN